MIPGCSYMGFIQLIFGAREAINEFQYQQATVLSNLFDEECGVDADEDNGLVFF